MTVTVALVQRPEGSTYEAIYTLPADFTSAGGQIFYKFEAHDGYQGTASPVPTGPLSTNLGYVTSASPLGI